jgi:hypothetical protein
VICEWVSCGGTSSKIISGSIAIYGIAEKKGVCIMGLGFVFTYCSCRYASRNGGYEQFLRDHLRTTSERPDDRKSSPYRPTVVFRHQLLASG